MAYQAGRWFEHLFGFRESLAAVKENFVVEEKEDHVELTSKVNNRTFNVGTFAVRNISSFKDLPEVGGGKLNIIHGRGGRGCTRLVDVLQAESEPEFDGATFLAASNFNCLEFVSGSQTAKDGVTGYVYDRTQGPFCVLATGPAVVYRNYFVKHDGVEGQLEKDIELLANTPINAYVKNGYPYIDREASDKLKEHDWSNLDQFMVGIHSNLEVTTTRGGEGFVDAPPGRIVHHVFGAALSYTYYCHTDETTLMIGEALLRAQYQATILAGWEHSLKFPGRAGSKRVVLTLLGGGVFGNSMEMIAEAIASCKDLIVKSGLEVYVVCFSDGSFREILPLLESVMQETHGKVIEPDGPVD